MAKTITPNLSILAGSELGNMMRLFANNKVDSTYYLKLLGVTGVGLISTPFHWYEKLYYHNKLKNHSIEDPVFILGHWRSGTTLVQNIMSLDPQAGFVSTLQSLFPEVVASKSVFRYFMQLTLPERRPVDNMRLNADYPMEEEFAIGNTNSYSFYNGWCFPQEMIDFYKKAIEFEGLTDGEIQQWKADYLRILKKAAFEANRDRLVIKNPPHTGRIPMLLEMFPNAKFIHIHRNPVNVFLSTRKLYRSTSENIRFQRISDEELENKILEVYKLIMNHYWATKDLIPAGNLKEIRFEEFEQDPYNGTKEIFDDLALPGFDKAAPRFKAYIDSRRNFKRNKHQISREELDKVLNEWGFAMERWGYEVPEDIEITNNKS